MKEISLNQWCAMLPNETKFQSYMDVPFEEIEKNPIWTLDGVNQMFGSYCLLTKENSDAYAIGTCKPILFDLSWLTREIEIGGEKFVPIHRLLEASNFNISQMDQDYINSFAESMVEVAPTYDDVQLLLSWKFNVFCLSDELIVKVSESFNPYK